MAKKKAASKGKSVSALHGKRTWTVRGVKVDLLAPVKILGRNMRGGRHVRGLSQSQLADLCGVTRFWISAVENGHPDTIDPRFMAVLAPALDVRLSALLDPGTFPDPPKGAKVR